MKFSLILATLNRSKEIRFCLDSLIQQTYEDFEVIVVDQSKDDSTKEVCEKYNIDIKYFKVDFCGLSKARNFGLGQASGQYFCLIDDDAVYDPSFLENVTKRIKATKQDNIIYSGYIFNTNNSKDYCKYKSIKKDERLTTREIIRYCPSAALVIPISVLNRVGNFDERFGVGSLYSSGEETDLLLRCTRKGYQVSYIDACKVQHPCIPIKTMNNHTTDPSKKEAYIRGQGAFFRKKMKDEHDFRVVPYFCEKLIKCVIKQIIAYSKHRADREYSAFMSGFRGR